MFTMFQARPGTTKRKQHYLKRITTALIGQPKPKQSCYLYVFNMKLTRPISEEQNTRGRKINAPEDTPRGFGIINQQRIPLVIHSSFVWCSFFPIYTVSQYLYIMIVKFGSVAITITKNEETNEKSPIF